ncbi:MAG: HPr family phosphocarrier protein [Sedimentisphaerales bacterium]
MSDSISQTEVEIKNANGLHMKPAMQLVDTASRFMSDIKVSNGKTVVDGKSIMQIAMLAATAGTKLTITAEGSDAQMATEALKDLIENKLFGEQSRQAEKESAG